MIGFVGPIRAGEMEGCVAGLRPPGRGRALSLHDADGLCRRSQRDGVAANILEQEA